MQGESYGKHPVVAQSGLSKNGNPGMRSGENVYAILLELTKELLCQPLQGWNAHDPGTACLLAFVLDYVME